MIRIAGVDGKEARKAVFKDEDGRKVVTPKPVTRSVVCGNVELTVSFKIGRKLTSVRDELYRESIYAAEDCIGSIISGEEWAYRMDPQCHSDAFMFTEPMLDEEKVTPLDMEEKLDRYAIFVDIVNKAAEPEVLDFILENAPKKKNGTFAKNKLTVIAAYPVVISHGGSMRYFELVGKAKTDNLLEITVQERGFSPEEWKRTKENVYLNYIESNC